MPHAVCIREKTEQKRQFNIGVNWVEGKKRMSYQVTQALTISFFQHWEIVMIIWYSVSVEKCRPIRYVCLNMHILAIEQKPLRKENNSQTHDCCFHCIFFPDTTRGHTTPKINEWLPDLLIIASKKIES